MITSIKKEQDITEAIAELEQDSTLQKEQLADCFQQNVQRLKPVNLVKSSAAAVASKPLLKKGLIVAGAGLLAILVLKKINRKSNGNKNLLFMALSGVGTMLIKKTLANGLQRVIKGSVQNR